MKEGDVVFCIDNNPKGMLNETVNPVSLSHNKPYRIKFSTNVTTNPPEWGKIIHIVNDDGQKASYRAERFINLQQWRDQQLNKLLNE